MEQTLITTVLWMLFGLTGIAWLIATFILSYHWRSYSDRRDVHIARAQHWYYGISILIFVVSALLIFTL